jgi:hypothetical protein
MHDVDPIILAGIYKEVFGFLALLLPLKPFVLMVEAKNTPLSWIIPFVRQVQEEMQNIYSVLETNISKGVLPLFLSAFLARIATNNYTETVACSTLVMLGRREPREKKMVLNAHGNTDGLPIIQPP